MKFSAVLLLAALALTVQAAPQKAPMAGQTYWMCADAQGRRVAQDHPCDEAATQPERGAPQATALPGHNAPQALPTPLEPSPQLRGRAPGEGAQEPTPAQFAQSHEREFIAIGVLVAFVMLLLAGGNWLLRNLAARVRARGDVRRLAPARIEASPELLSAWKLAPGRHDPLLPVTPTAAAPRRPPLPMIPMPQADPVFSAPARGLTLERLRRLEQPQLETLVAGYWKVKGYSAAQVGSNIHLHQAADLSKLFALVQCRVGAHAVGAVEARELWGAAQQMQAKIALLYAMSGFSADAQAFAQGKHLKLFSGEDLLGQIQGLTVQQRQQLPDPMAPA